MKITNKRLVSILLCLAMVLAVLPVAAFAAGTTTLYCAAPDSWTNANVYWWGSSTSVDWPGEAMTKGADGLWYYAVPSDATNVIFNNKVGEDGVQSSDLAMPTDDKVQFNYSAKEWVAYGSEIVVPETVYYLRGTMNGWGATDALTNNGDGTYSITVSLTAGDYMYKVGTDDWSWACPADDASLSLAEDCDVTFVLDVEAYTVTATAGSIVVPEYDYYVAGSAGLCGAEWDPAQNLMAADGEDLYTITFSNIEAGSYEFKVTTGSWDTPAYGNNGENYVITVDALSNVTINFNAATTEITVDIAEVALSSAPATLVLGDNAFEIVDGDTKALTSTYTATEAGVLVVNVSAMSTFDAYEQVWSDVPAANIPMQFGRMYAILVNGQQVWLPGEVEIAAGDVVEIGIQSYMGNAAKVTVNLSIREPGVNDVKWQLPANASPNDATTDLRLMTWVDSLDYYSSVTFNVSVDGVAKEPLTVTNVYSAVMANGQAVAAADLFGYQASYIATYVITDVPIEAYDSEIQVTVTWTDMDGNETTSETRTFVISDNWA